MRNTAAALISAALLSAPVAGAQTLTTSATGTDDGYYYSFWKDAPGQVSFGLQDGGRYTAVWSETINNWVGGKGWQPGGRKTVNYSGDY